MGCGGSKAARSVHASLDEKNVDKDLPVLFTVKRTYGNERNDLGGRRVMGGSQIVNLAFEDAKGETWLTAAALNPGFDSPGYKPRFGVVAKTSTGTVYKLEDQKLTRDGIMLLSTSQSFSKSALGYGNGYDPRRTPRLVTWVREKSGVYSATDAPSLLPDRLTCVMWTDGKRSEHVAYAQAFETTEDAKAAHELQSTTLLARAPIKLFRKSAWESDGREGPLLSGPASPRLSRLSRLSPPLCQNTRPRHESRP